MSAIDDNQISKMSTTSILEGLRRLSQSLKDMDDKSSPVPNHYQDIPDDIQQSYDLMLQGARLVHATSTKYTLVGKATTDGEEKTVAQDLLRGCQFIGAGALVIGDDSYGCCRSTRVHTKRACRAILATVTNLVEAFVNAKNSNNNDSSNHNLLLEKDNNLAAQKCGAVWQTCDVLLEKKLPQGNRNAMRRDLFTWMKDCNETMTEFQDMIDMGPSSEVAEETAVNDDDNDDDDDDDDDFDDFGDAGDDQYSPMELDVAKPCVALVKCSRGSINVALKASECVGGLLKLPATEVDDDKRKSVLTWIQLIHDKARYVGEGMTDLGTLLYPTLSLDDIERQSVKQKDAILTVLAHVLDTTDMDVSEEVLEFASTLRTAVEARYEELIKAIEAARSHSVKK